MRIKTQVKNLRLKQLDTRLNRFRVMTQNPIPENGWLREIRETLSMSARQLASRVGISQATLAKIEKGEIEKTVSLKTLNRIAVALECELVYALIPKESLEKLVRMGARRTAERLIRRVSHSMELEKQGISTRKKEEQIKAMADEMARELSKEIWEDWK